MSEYCVLCKRATGPLGSHVEAYHPGAKLIGDILWLSRHEAVYRGKVYAEKRPRRLEPTGAPRVFGERSLT